MFAPAVLLAAVMASAATTTQQWTLGWDNFGEPLNLTKSKIKWSVSPTRKLTVTFGLVGAKATKLYQVGINFFCETFPATFGQFSTNFGKATVSPSHDRQRVTKDRDDDPKPHSPDPGVTTMVSCDGIYLATSSGMHFYTRSTGPGLRMIKSAPRVAKLASSLEDSPLTATAPATSTSFQTGIPPPHPTNLGSP